MIILAEAVPAQVALKVLFPKCEKWSPKRSCPADSVAVAVRAYSTDAESGVVGFELRCKAIDVTP